MQREEPIGFLMGFRRPIPIFLGDVITFGRDPQNSFPLDDAMASRRHAALSCSENGVVSIKDLGSRNKTWLDDAPVYANKPTALETGTRIRIGGKVFSYVANTGNLEPGKVARKSSKQLNEMDTVSSGLKWKDGNIIEEEIEEEVSNEPEYCEDILKTITTPLKAIAPQIGPALSGQLSLQNLPNLFQFINQNANTGELVVESNGHLGTLVFDAGNIVYAKTETLEGEDAVYACALKREGTFQFNAMDSAPLEPRNVSDSMMHIILECCRRYDHDDRRQPPV